MRRHPSRRQKSVRRAGLEPRLESLEQRVALTGNVQGAAWQPGVWRINGDSSPARRDDTIVVERNPSNPSQLRAVVNGAVVGTRPENAVARIVVNGGLGNDTIRIDVPGNTRLATLLVGGAGNDDIRGGDGRDTIDGGPGNDALNGGGGNDAVSGGAGVDSLVGGLGDDVLDGGPGRDTLRGGAGRNALDGGTGIDVVYGTAGVDRVRLDPGERLIGNESTNPLRQVNDLTKVEGWFVDTALAQWGGLLGKEAGLWWGLAARTYDSASVATAGGAAGAGTAGGDFSGTNNQVAGVDEADMVKTDGEHLYVIAGDGVDILDVSAAGALAAVAHVSTPGNERALFLHGTRLTVISDESRWEPLVDDGSTSVGRVAGWWNHRWQSQTVVTIVDVSAAESPTILETTRIDGWFQDARAIGDRVTIVTQDSFAIPAPAIIAIPPAEKPAAGGSGSAGGSAEAAPAAVIALPPMGRIQPPVADDGTRYVYEDAAAYRARLARAWDESAIPGYTVTVAGGGSSGGELAVPGRTYLPVKPRDSSLLAVVTFDVDDDVAGPDATTAVAGVSGQLYASTSSLYVWATNWGNWWDALDQTWTTNIYKFDLGDATVPLVAMGAVPGMAINQFAFDETAAGLLRVATTSGWGDAASSGVFVLAAAAGNLRTVGGVTGLAPGERIYSVRFIGDRGYVSTFRQVDPLFVIDLSKPAAPRVVGQLKIPGFSSYLHPLDDGRLLGIGRDVDPATGRVLGLQLSIFDVSDPANPRRTSTYTFPGNGWETWSAALWDHHAFGWFAKQGILAFPLQQGWGPDDRTGLVVFKVDSAKSSAFTNLGRIEHGDDVQRSVRIGEYLYSVSWGEVQVHRIDDPATALGRVKLAERVFAGYGWVR
jgi:uncharacterized secreted protein with C-terminal beta-propeller domain